MIEVMTQAELDAAVASGEHDVIVVRGGGGWLCVSSDSVTVDASGSVTVWAYDSATVWASDSATVWASGSATVRASGSATVHAGALVAIHNHNPDNKHGTVTITGGVVIDVRKPATIHEWFDRYGVTPDDGVVTLFKAVADDYESSRGFRYVPGTIPVAPDWDGGKAECGGGLHFCATPWIAKSRFKFDATRFVACPILVTDIAFHPDGNLPEKVKARGCCAPVWECDIDGNPVAAAEKAS